MPLTISLWFLSYRGEAHLRFIRTQIRKGVGGGGGCSTFGVWGGPRDDAPHQAAVEQHFLGEAVVPAEMLQVLPPLRSLGRRTHGWKFSSSAKHHSRTSTTKRSCEMLLTEQGICGIRDFRALKFFPLRKKWKPLQVLCSHREQKLILAASCLKLCMVIMKCKTFQSALFLCGLSFSSPCSYFRTSEALQPSISIWLRLSRPSADCHPNKRNFKMPLNKRQQ